MSLSYVEENAKGITIVPLRSRLLTDRKFFLTGRITADTANEFAQQMLYLTSENAPIDLYINSIGGEVNAGLAIYDIIQSCPCELNIYCVGQAASMAAVLLASGQKGRRFLLPHSRVMIHEVLLSSSVSGSATSIYKMSESILEIRDLVNGILAEHTGKTLKEINKATSFDNVMNADEAVKFGICDKVVNGMEIRRM